MSIQFDEEVIINVLLLISFVLSVWLAAYYTLAARDFWTLKHEGHNGLVKVLLQIFLFWVLWLIWDMYISIQNLPTLGIVTTGVSIYRIVALASKILLKIFGLRVTIGFMRQWRELGDS